MEKFVFKIPKSEIDFKVTISGGVYCDKNNVYPNFKTLLKKADQALYVSKDEGRNTISIHGE